MRQRDCIAVIGASVTPRRSHIVLFRAANHLEGLDLHSDIIGGGSLCEQLTTAVKHPGIEQEVTLPWTSEGLGRGTQYYVIARRTRLLVLRSHGEGFCPAAVPRGSQETQVNMV